MAKPYLTEECFQNFLNLFQDSTFSEEEKELLSRNRTEVFFKKNELIIKQGSLANQLVFIQKGITKSYFEYGNTKQTICMHPPKSLLGIQALAEANVYHCNLSALEEVSACMFDLKTIKNIALQNASFVFQLLNIIIEHQSVNIDRIFSLKLKSSNAKIADVLLCLSQRVYKSDTFDFNFTIEDIANLTGVPPDTASGIWKNFQTEGIIQLEPGKLIILDKEKLLFISSLL